MYSKFIIIPIVVDGDMHEVCSEKCNHVSSNECLIFKEDISNGRCGKCMNNSLYAKSALKYFKGVTNDR